MEKLIFMIDELSIITIPATEDTPEIIMDSVNFNLRIKGPSFEDPFETFGHVSKWINSIKFKTNKIVCVFEFSIISSTSNKLLIDVFQQLEDLYKNGKEILIKWHYDHFDEDMKEEGESLANTITFPIEYIAI